MTPLHQTPAQRRRALKLLVTLIACAAALWFLLESGRGSSETATVSTQSLFTVPRGAAALPTPIATTAPVVAPTVTAAPTPTAPETATATPTAPPTPEVEPETADDAAASAPTARSVPAAAQAQSSAPAAAPSPTAPVVVLPAAPVVAATPTSTAVAVPTVAVPTVVVPTVVVPTVVVPTPIVAPTATTAPAAPNTGQAEAYALGRVNAVRAQAGLGPLTLDPSLSAIALDWSRQMSISGFSHRPGAQLSAMLPAGWQEWGENIVTITAVDIAAAQESLERSPGHYQNMVGPFTNVGIGVYVLNGQLWMTQVFARY